MLNYSQLRQDMSPLYPDIIACLSIQVLEIKKMVYLYLINYARSKPEMVKHAMHGLLEVSEGPYNLSYSSTDPHHTFIGRQRPQRPHPRTRHSHHVLHPRSRGFARAR